MCLLTLISFLLGCEVAFKCANRDVIFLINDCYVLTVIHIVILALMPFPGAQDHVKFLVELVVPLTWEPIGALIVPATQRRLACLKVCVVSARGVFGVLGTACLSSPCVLL